MALASIGDALITTDLEGAVTFLNPVAQTLTGWTMDAALGQPLEMIFRIVDEESRIAVENPALRALRDGVAVGPENHTLLIARDGTNRPIDDTAVPVCDAAGAVEGVVLVFRDVTERRRQEHSLRDALAYADSILDTVREPFLVLDDQLRVVTSSRSFHQTFELEPEELRGRTLQELGKGEWDLGPLLDRLHEVLLHGGAFQDLIVTHDAPAAGRPTQLLLNGRLLRNQGDRSARLLLGIEDVSQRRRAEQYLADSELRYRRLFETAQDAILILDARTGLISDANPFIQQMLGYSHAELVGKELWQLGMFRDKEAIRTAFTRLQAEGYIRFDNLPLESADGREVEVEFVSNVYSVGADVVIQCNIRDISDRNRLERRTQEQALALIDLHRRKDEFLAMLGHELRSPLAPISNAVRLLAMQLNGDPVQRHALEVIERQVGQLTRLVDDLLEVSRIVTGRIHLRTERMTLDGIVGHAVETVRPTIEARRHVLRVSLPSEPVWLQADAARLQQVFVNLLTNAAKYTQPGGSLELTAAVVNDACVVRVLDNGPGISPEFLPRIFELFSQSDRQLHRSEGGLGIGLSLVRRLVEMHGGTVEAHSSLSHGSEFVVRLPLSSSAMKSLAPPAPLGVFAGPSLRVLAVDDNVDSAEMLGMLLTSSGHRSWTAHDGREALRLARDVHPDVMLLDIGLPGMDGYAVAAAVREDPALAPVRLIALTGYGQVSDRARAIEAGFDHHLVKPADFARVLAILADIQPKSA